MGERQVIFRHAGYEMRSHSETRWASIMDALRVAWVYEPRVIDTRHGWYLPDFYLPAAGVFVEVKGPQPSKVEIEKAQDVESATGCPVIFAHGDPEMLHGELFHGMLSYYGERCALSYSTAEIGSLVRKHYDLRTYAGYLTAGNRRERPGVVSIGQALDELMAGWMSRGDRNAFLAEMHAPLNKAKAERYTQTSRAEWVLAEFERLVRVRRQQGKAA